MSNSRHARSFQQILVRMLVLPALVTVLLVAGLLGQTQALLNASTLVDHTDQVIGQANVIQRLLLDLETGVRGYLVTSDPQFLEPYTRARGEIEPAFATLAGRIQDNPAQIQRLALIRTSYQMWASGAQELVTLHDAGGAYQAIPVNLRSKQGMDTLRAQIAEFITTEEALRDTRTQAVQRTTQLTIGSGIAVLVVLGVGLALITRRQILRVAQLYEDALVTAQDQARALQASEERFRVTLASLGDAVIATDTASRVTFLNEVAEQLTGWGAADAQGQPITAVFPIINESSRQTVENPVERTLREGRIVGLANHTLLVARDGSERPIDDSGAPVRDGGGQIIGAVLVFRDISDHKAAEEALRQSEERLRIALRGSPITVYTQDRALRYTWLYNPAPGYDAADTIGKLDSDIMYPEDAARLMALKRQVLTSVTGLREEIRVSTPTGELFFDLSIEPLRDSAGAVVGVTGAAQDITSRKHAEFERQELLLREQDARTAAQQALHLRDIYFSVASHELKTPLTTLMGNIQLIQRRAAREGFLSERDQRAFRVIGAQAQRLDRLIGALLDVTRLESGKLSLETAPLDLAELTAQTVADIEPTLINHTIRLTLPDAPLLIIGDSVRLEQVLQNLIQNAVKYSPNGGEVQVQVQTEPDCAAVTVSDSGIGIPLEAQANLFTRFFRASNVGEHMPGLGIGLYVVREIVQLHGGTISVSSEPGVGSRFTVRLPLPAVSEH